MGLNDLKWLHHSFASYELSYDAQEYFSLYRFYFIATGKDDEYALSIPTCEISSYLKISLECLSYALKISFKCVKEQIRLFNISKETCEDLLYQHKCTISSWTTENKKEFKNHSNFITFSYKNGVRFCAKFLHTSSSNSKIFRTVKLESILMHE